jgi:flagellar FliL protein
MAEDEKDLEGEEGEATGGGKKKLLIIIIAAVLLIAIGVAVAMMLMGGDSPEGEETAEEVAEEVVRPDPLYHEFTPQFVVNLPPGGRAKMMQLSLQVMAHDQAVIDYIEQNDPMLRHHLFNLFSTQDASILYQRKGREALAKATEKLLEKKMKENNFEGDVQAVYFSELVLQ